MSKKAEQLGMNPSTASHRLVKDLLWNFIEQTGANRCFCCGRPMTREDFSIEHKVPWLDSPDPAALFFDLSNISFSHRTCNIAGARRGGYECGTQAQYKRGCRCEPCRSVKSEARRREHLKSKGGSNATA